jgi:uncharacterized membrane protein YeaQ/YmgE (transglycosylase-associated protein family)
MAIFAYMLVGLIVGILVRVAMPATRFVGFWGSLLLGMAGGIIGGLISSVFNPEEVLSRVHPLGIVLAVIVSALVSIGLILATRRRVFG